MTPALLTPASITALLREFDLHPSRALGQNFLADPNTARRIVEVAGVRPGDRVLEIGPGLGSLTLALAQSGASVTALEVDRHVVGALRSVVAPLGNVEVVEGDALDAGLVARLTRADADGDPPWAVVANLPYNIATPVVMEVLESAPNVASLLVMVQREVGDRLAARPGTKAYGAVTVKVAYFAAATVVGAVPPTVFIPRPRVDSALVRLTRHPAPPVVVPSTEALFELVGAGFATRRKTLRNALGAHLGADPAAVFAAAGVAPTARAESLDLAAWGALANARP